MNRANRARSWTFILLPLTRCGCHSADRCPCWPDSYVGKFRTSRTSGPA